ncbi:D-2-hydroxyacid dehydrogenase [Ligilactobacillus ceti]|uniref:D-lactate dehydrogenase n=1 Tax=Ligilactobacillus ceti DSM 22408 TaxID=1122146 RepID=A0A0R2KHA6_9LACO|nr:D-2-hydroxyacid dehydrogenase [Ligilactobacillus ceti]KRN88744.1 D-lactate dehydrogenase [Ligilactobacillus ceti DSM 22408]
MKFIAFAVREEEQPYFASWSQATGIEVELHKDIITPENVALIQGFDAVIGLQADQYPDELFAQMEESGIKVLAIRNVGVDNIHLDVAKKHHVTITNVPAYSPNAIAEFSITQLLQLLRRTAEFNARMERDDYRWTPLIGKEIRSLTIGVIGTGRIGQVAIDIYRGFGAKVIAYDPYQNPTLAQQGIYVSDLADLYQQADVITLHLPATPENYHMLNEKTFAQMKDGVYIINTARGSLIDTQALVDAVKKGKVAGAALDTYENELQIFNYDLGQTGVQDPLFVEMKAMPQIIMTPHIAFYTETAVENMVKIALASALSVIETGTAETLVLN